MTFFYLPMLLFAAILLQSEAYGQNVAGGSIREDTVWVPRQLFPALRNDSVLFQSGTGNHSRILLFLKKENRVVAPDSFSFYGHHPVWVPGKNKMVCDTGAGLSARLILYDFKTKKKSRLINRHLPGKEASFTPSRHLVAFSGFDDRTRHWQVYTYDFVYDNLNRLTAEKGNCRFPVFSPDGKTLVYTVYSDSGKTFLKRINWYGAEPKVMATGVKGKACWTPDNWRVVFIVPGNHGDNLFSVQEDGAGLRLVKSFSSPVCCPAITQDGKTLWLSVKGKKQYRLQRFGQ